MVRVVIVEDNDNVREAVRRYLELEGMEVSEFASVVEAERSLRAKEPDLVILDIMLPDGDGFLLAKRLRSEMDSHVPIIFLTARTEESDRITGLELGADDYVVKPFSPRELVLRVKAVLRRTHQTTGAEAGVEYLAADARLEIRETEHRVLLDGNPVALTAAEWNIPTYLVHHSPQVLGRSQILETCLGSIAEGSERTVDTHVKNIRIKLGKENWIETVRGFGYRFNGKLS